jgi:hypothetical protein
LRIARERGEIVRHDGCVDERAMGHDIGHLEGEVGRWIATYDRDVDRAFAECRRADWLIQIAMAVGLDRRLVVAAAADAATLALRRTRGPDLRPFRSVTTALQWSEGEAGSAEAWAAGFAASQAARDLAAASPLASEAALAAAAVGFGCDLRADDAYYLERAYPVAAIEHTIRAFGTERSVGQSACLEAVTARITCPILATAVRRASVRPPPRRI